MPAEIPTPLPACPFCGGEARRSLHLCRPVCRSCGASAQSDAAWSRRVTPDAWVRKPLEQMLTQLDVSDSYAREARRVGEVLPTVWEIQNNHIRYHIREIFAALASTPAAGDAMTDDFTDDLPTFDAPGPYPPVPRERRGVEVQTDDDAGNLIKLQSRVAWLNWELRGVSFRPSWRKETWWPAVAIATERRGEPGEPVPSHKAGTHYCHGHGETWELAVQDLLDRLEGRKPMVDLAEQARRAAITRGSNTQARITDLDF